MATLRIIEWPAKVLETRANEVTQFDSELLQFVKDMHETMDAEGGIGLAANQVNVLKRVLTVYIPHQDNRYESSGEEGGEEKRWWHNKRFTFINPVIVHKKGKDRIMEGCLSFPEIYEYVDRAAKVTVRAQDETGKEFEVEADGLFAICLQHEIDHIDGIVFISRMSRLKHQMITRKLQKRQLLKVQNVEA